MIMSIGTVNRAFSCAFLGLILCASPGFGQRPANRTAPKTEQNKPARKQAGRELRYAPNRYILFLQDEPVAAHFTAHEQLQTAAAISYRQGIESRQQSVMQDLSARRIQIAGSASMVMNAIFVVATPDRVAELRSVPGVIGVMPERLVRPSLNKATSLANAPAAWAQTSIGGQGNAGAGMKIGILDSGIDQTSPAFNDAGFSLPTTGTWPKCNATVPGTPSDCGRFTNNKVIVARSYASMIGAGSNPANPAADSQPDDFSARDRDGHGSAVAAVAAAVQNSAGTVPFSGMAPRAYLGSYKVEGSPGVNGAPESAIIKALDDAVSDGMDIVNFSLGTAALAGPKDDVQCGNAAGVWCDPMAHAFEVAAENGTVITVAAGNQGFDGSYLYPNSISSPADAPSVIAVGATINSHVFNPSVSVNGAAAPSNLKNLAADISDSYFYPSLVGANSGTLVDVTTLGDNGQACSALPALSLHDKFALIQRSPTNTGCSFDAKAINATNAGAIGIVFYNNASAALTSPGQICYGNPSGNCDLYGPGVMISLTDGQNLKAYVDANPGTTVTIDTAGSEQALTSAVNNLAIYSSLGPAIDGSIKPDMVATGGFDDYQSLTPSATNGMYTVGQSYDPNGEVFTTNGFVAANGTSFAAPLVAGAAALVKQAHPTWSALQIKSALVNFAAQDVTSDDFGDTVDVQNIGAGRLDANAAVTASVTAVPSTLSFGFLATGVALPKPIPVTVSNFGTASVTLTVAVVPGVNTTASATVTADQKSLTVAGFAAGKPGTATLNVSLTGSVPVAGEYDGAVTLTSTSPAITLRMPYMFMVGDGSSPYPIPLWDLSGYQGYGYTQSYGAVNQDVGPLPVQVLDSWGVPVKGMAVTYTVTPSGGVTLKPVPGSPGTTGTLIPFQPSNCSPSSSSSSLVCTTNSYGIAWAEMVNGPNVVDYTTNAAVDATIAAGGDITNYFTVIAQPNLQFVLDNGAYGTTIAPGSYVALKGTNLVDPNDMANPTTGDLFDTTFTGGRLPLTFDFITVSFDAPATGNLPAISVPGYVYYVSTNQVNISTPWELENYPSAQVKMTAAGSVPIPSNVVTVPISNYTPAFLMYNSGSVYIADTIDPVNGVNCSPQYIVSPACPTTKGSGVSFYANGLGPVSPQPASGDIAPSAEPFARTTTTPVVMIGSQQAQVTYSGLSGGFVGLYQINATIPSNVASGNQPITIAIGGKTSPGSITEGGTTYQIVLPIK